MLTTWQKPIFDRLAKQLPFLQNQPLSTFSLAAILGDGTYVLNGQVGSVFDLGLGMVHPGFLLTLGGCAALIGHLFLLASADRVDQMHEQGIVSTLLEFCRRLARFLTLGWKPANPFMLGFAALTFNGLMLALDALWEMLFFGVTPVALLQLTTGLIVIGGLGAAMLSRFVVRQAWRDRLNLFAPQLLAYATIMTLALGLFALAPFILLGGLLFVISNTAQHVYALRMQQLEGRNP